MKSYKTIAIDSMILIYLLEGREPFCGRIKELLEGAQNIYFSSFGMGEVLTGFEKSGDKSAQVQFLSFIEAYKKISIIGFGKQEAILFAQIRSKYPSIKAPDAIHLATAISARVDAFITNDKKLMTVEELCVQSL